MGDKTPGILNGLQKMREQKKKEYTEYLFSTPELGYVKNNNPSNYELSLIYEKIENSLGDARKLFLKNVSEPGKENWNAHFKFKPIIESLLKKNPSWCSVAMKVSKENEKKEKWDLIADISYSIIAGLPCLAGGPLGAVACIGLGLEVGRVGIKNSEEVVDMTLGKNLLGKEYSNIEELSNVERQAFLQKVFLPLSVWGGVVKGGGVIAEKIAIKKAENLTGKIATPTVETMAAPITKETLATKAFADVKPSVEIQPSTNLVADVSPKDPQVELWKMKEAGENKKVKLFEEKLRKQMKNQKISEVKQYGGTESARLVKLEDGTLAVWKPIKEGSGATEVASYEVDQVLGLNYVPMTVGKNLETQKGTLQIFVNNAGDTGNKYSPAHFKMFDYLIGNIDRRATNYFVTNERRVVAIDNSMSFNSRQIANMPNTFKKASDNIFAKLEEVKKSGTVELKYVDKDGNVQKRIVNEKQLRIEAQSLFSSMTINKEVYQRLKQTTDSQWRQRLQGLLSSEQIKGLLDRRDEIVEAVEKARRIFGEEVLHDKPHSPIFNSELKKFD